MKKFLQFSLMMALVAIATSAFAQKKLKEGVVKFEMVTGDSASMEMAMLAGSTMDFYFTGDKQRMDMQMMGGLMRIQTIVPLQSVKDAAILMDIMGQKYHIVEISEDALGQTNSFMNMDGMQEITYDEKDKKEIAGYDCYRANVKMDGGFDLVYYISEKIQPLAPVKGKSDKQLKGFPLQIIMDTGQGFEMNFQAVTVSKEVKKEDFDLPEGYSKMTMEEFEKEMGNMKMGFGN
jgi:hypothetical protein